MPLRHDAAGSASSGSPAALRHANVLLVTIDTLRADRVGAYGSRAGLTPTLDRLAAEGVRIDRAYAHVPLTLPSHTTLMTGALPFTNGVRDNGSFRFDGQRPTLATALKGAGYRTGAFVASFVLDARFGLNAGFDDYDDRNGSRSAGGDLAVLERRADDMVDAALAWIGPASPAATPWFAWLHLYDPHDPYDPPEPFKSRLAGDAYGGEVAFADAQIGRALQTLRERGQLDRTLVVVAADHGESLGEHQERTHGLFVYDATTRVPLLLWAPAALAPAVVRGPVGLVDVMPTVLDLVGVPRCPATGAVSWPAARGQPVEDRDVYLEALNANLTRHWAPLTALVAGTMKFIDLPEAELYDLAADPGETRNLHATQAETATPIARRLFALRARGRPAAPVGRGPRDRASPALARLPGHPGLAVGDGPRLRRRGRSQGARRPCTTPSTTRSLPSRPAGAAEAERLLKRRDRRRGPTSPWRTTGWRSSIATPAGCARRLRRWKRHRAPATPTPPRSRRSAATCRRPATSRAPPRCWRRRGP